MTELLQDWVRIQAETRPHAPAVIAQEERLTYGQLDARSNRLARLLRDAGCSQGDRLGLLMPSSPMAIVAMLGICKADCICVPLDPSSSPAGVQGVLESCDCRCVLAAGVTGDLLDHLFGSLTQSPGSFAIGWLGEHHPRTRLIVPRFELNDLRAYSPAPRHHRNTSSDPAQILFASGGTRTGVVVTHRSVVHFVEWARRYFGISTSDRISCHSPLHSDLSTFDIFGTFAAGAELHIVPPELAQSPHRLAEFIRTSELTQWCSTPPILNRMARFDSVESHDFPTLKRVMWCGGVFPTFGLTYWMKRLPHVAFTGLYGRPETTIASGYHTLRTCPADANAEIPIGAGCDGKELLVLDKSLEPVPPGVIGDLYVRGVGLSPGYWKDPEKTAAVFARTPRSTDPNDRLYKTGDFAKTAPDGLVYLHRHAEADVKSRDYRIELGETDGALSTIGTIERRALRKQFHRDSEVRTA